jgi:phage tail sheath protein FI
MASTYSTPGVYIEEISLLPPNIVRVATAVPAFIGYTENTLDADNVSLIGQVVKIKSLLDYEEIFGGEAPTTAAGGEVTVTFATDGSIDSVVLAPEYYLYPALRHFYANGGGDAYIVTVGDYGDTPSDTAMISGLTTLKQADEPTLIVMPDLFNGAFDATTRGNVQVAALSHCNTMQDRFAILDVFDTGNATADAGAFRTNIGNQYLKYGAAYYPSLETSIGTTNTVTSTSINIVGGNASLLAAATAKNDTELLDYLGSNTDVTTLTANVSGSDNFTEIVAAVRAEIAAAQETDPADEQDRFRDDLFAPVLSLATWLYNFNGSEFNNADLEAAKLDSLDKAGSDLKTQVTQLYLMDRGYGEIHTLTGEAVATYAPLGLINGATGFAAVDFEYELSGIAAGTITTSVAANYGPAAANIKAAIVNGIAALGAVLDALEDIYEDWSDIVDGRSFDTLLTTSSVIAGMDQAIKETGYTLPPSAAMAGVYAAVDASRGVWKAPANVSLSAVSKVAKMAPDTLDDLNMPTNGKAINAIRFFRGQGILVYGARTLAGNDNEWRYIPVRRTFLMVEESIKKATEPFVFEPNDANTWQKIRGMIEAFLTGLWRDGALAGSVPKDAFYVHCALGTTMTADDILNGKLIIEVGLAVVRPAEFIILRFSHKLQES